MHTVFKTLQVSVHACTCMQQLHGNVCYACVLVVQDCMRVHLKIITLINQTIRLYVLIWTAIENAIPILCTLIKQNCI